LVAALQQVPRAPNFAELPPIRDRADNG
jgi:hypothetical protein